MGLAPEVMMSFTLIATKSIPIVSCVFISNASLSLVPTPSVPATRNESPASYILLQSLRASAGNRVLHPPTKRYKAAETSYAWIELLYSSHQLSASINIDACLLVIQSLRLNNTGLPGRQFAMLFSQTYTTLSARGVLVRCSICRGNATWWPPD